MELAKQILNPETEEVSPSPDITCNSCGHTRPRKSYAQIIADTNYMPKVMKNLYAGLTDDGVEYDIMSHIQAKSLLEHSEYNSMKVINKVKVQSAAYKSLSIQYSIPQFQEVFLAVTFESTPKSAEFVVNGVVVHDLDVTLEGWIPINTSPINSLTAPYGQRFINVKYDKYVNTSIELKILGLFIDPALEPILKADAISSQNAVRCRW